MGSSTVYPVQAPYGTSVLVCFAQGSGGTATNTSYLPSPTSQISNTNLAGSTITSLTLPITSSGAFTHSGLCPTS